MKAITEVHISVRNTVCPQEVLMVEAIENYTKFTYLSGKTFVIAKTLKDIHSSLKAYSFIRPNRSMLVNQKQIKRNSMKENKLLLVLSNNKKVFVSRRRKEAIEQSLGY